MAENKMSEERLKEMTIDIVPRVICPTNIVIQNKIKNKPGMMNNIGKIKCMLLINVQHQTKCGIIRKLKEKFESVPNSYQINYTEINLSTKEMVGSLPLGSWP